MRWLLWTQLRRRWRGAAVIGLVLGFGGAAAITAAAGARRTDSAFPGMLAHSDGAQLLVSGGSGHAPTELYDKLAAVDGVQRAAVVVGVDLIPMHVAKNAGTTIEACSIASANGFVADRPNVVAGRLPDPARDDEALITK